MRSSPTGSSTTLTFAVLILLLAAGCATDQEPVATPTPEPTPELGLSCDAPQDGYRVGYPEGWHPNDVEEASPCSWFHPEPFQLPDHGEVTGIAIMISVEDGDFDQRSGALTDAPDVAEINSREDTTVAGESAVRAETTRSGDAFYPEGTRITA